MGRLFLIILAIVAIVVVGARINRSLRSLAHSTQESTLPKTVQTISYVLLIVLMFGVVTGWLGGL